MLLLDHLFLIFPLITLSLSYIWSERFWVKMIAERINLNGLSNSELAYVQNE